MSDQEAYSLIARMYALEQGSNSDVYEAELAYYKQQVENFPVTMALATQRFIQTMLGAEYASRSSR